MKVYLGRFPKDPNKKRKIEIRIDNHDVWSADHTLALIIVPVLKKLREDLHGYPSDFCKMKDNGWEVADDCDGFERWKLTIDKMIWAFEQCIEDNDDDFWIVKGKWHFEDLPDREDASELKWDIEPVVNEDARAAYWDRVEEGLALFGKHFQSLWN